MCDRFSSREDFQSDSKRLREEDKAAVEQKPAPVCPKCGKEDLIYVEDHPVWWTVTEIKDGKVLMPGHANTDFDVDGTDERLQCAECGATFPVPEGLELEWY